MGEGFVVWLTGLSGSGKSTIATALAEALRARGAAVELLDGDEVRTHLSKGLGFSREDRDTNVLRIAWVAGKLSAHGAAVITSAISPYAETRAAARDLAPRFVEVFVDAPLEACMRRDTKGLYRKAIHGEISNFTGVSDPYEVPEAPDVHVRTDEQTVEESLSHVLAYLEKASLVSPSPASTE